MSVIVYSEEERDLIPAEIRSVGMSVLVVNEYTLVGGIANSNWVKITPSFTGDVPMQIKEVFVATSNLENIFTLSKIPLSGSEQVFIRGISRDLTAEYSITGNTLKINSGIAKKDSIITVIYNFVGSI